MVEDHGFGSGAWRWCTGQCTAPNTNRCVGCDRPASDRTRGQEIPRAEPARRATTHVMDGCYPYKWGVAPRAGAWIETTLHMAMELEDSSPLAQGRGSK